MVAAPEAAELKSSENNTGSSRHLPAILNHLDASRLLSLPKGQLVGWAPLAPGLTHPWPTHTGGAHSAFVHGLGALPPALGKRLPFSNACCRNVSWAAAFIERCLYRQLQNRYKARYQSMFSEVLLQCPGRKQLPFSSFWFTFAKQLITGLASLQC